MDFPVHFPVGCLVGYPRSLYHATIVWKEEKGSRERQCLAASIRDKQRTQLFRLEKKERKSGEKQKYSRSPLLSELHYNAEFSLRLL